MGWPQSQEVQFRVPLTNPRGSWVVDWRAGVDMLFREGVGFGGREEVAAQPVWRGCYLSGNFFEPCTRVPWVAARSWQGIREGSVCSQRQGARL